MDEIRIIDLTSADLLRIVREATTAVLAEQLPALLPKPKQPDDYLTGEEVCDLLRITFVTLRKRRSEGLLTGIRVGRRVLYRRADIERALATPKKGGR